MAPRERRVEGGSFALLKGDSAKRFLDQHNAEKGEYVAPTSGQKPKDIAPGQGVAALENNDASAQAEVLREAARKGTPFCEECQKAIDAAKAQAAAPVPEIAEPAPEPEEPAPPAAAEPEPPDDDWDVAEVDAVEEEEAPPPPPELEALAGDDDWDVAEADAGDDEEPPPPPPEPEDVAEDDDWGLVEGDLADDDDVLPPAPELEAVGADDDWAVEDDPAEDEVPPPPDPEPEAVVAKEVEPEGTVDEEALLHCDLCILAYQLYHQSVIWPLDPWYEVLARGATDRRSLYMGKVHAFAKTLPARADHVFGGPGPVGGVGPLNDTLDPVLSNYMQIRPRDPAITGDGGKYMALRAPAYIVDRIRKASVVSYAGAWQEEWPHGKTQMREVIDYGDGQDELIAFEGGTGAAEGKGAAFSLMGYVLKRTRKDGGWDAHIAFRGSRSGSAARAAVQGLSAKGNPDWVTDMGMKLSPDSYVGPGNTHEGFTASIKRCWGTLRAALVALNEKYGAPARIHVTGHSLGAALASLCTSTLYQGTPALYLRRELSSWKFSEARGYYMALPPVASQDYCNEFNRLVGDRSVAPYVAGDIVVQVSRSVATKDMGVGWIGARVGENGYSPSRLDRMARPAGSDGQNAHEIFLIRAGLLAKRAAAGKPAAAEVKRATPFAYFESFQDLLDGKTISYVDGDKPNLVTPENLRKVLTNYGFAAHFRTFLSLLKDVVSDPASYRGAHTDESYRLAGERVALAVEMAGNVDSEDPAVVADTVGTQVAAMLGFEAKTELVRKGWKIVKQTVVEADGAVLKADELLGQDFNTRLGLGLVLAAFQEKQRTTLEHFAAVPELKLCLEVTLPDL